MDLDDKTCRESAERETLIAAIRFGEGSLAMTMLYLVLAAFFQTIADFMAELEHHEG